MVHRIKIKNDEIKTLFKFNFNLFKKNKPKVILVLIANLKHHLFGPYGVCVRKISWLRNLLYPEQGKRKADPSWQVALPGDEGVPDKLQQTP